VCPLSLLGDRQWSSSGDRYLVSLFRDLLFHSTVGPTLLPVVDLAFVVDQLNRVDVASSEKALLHSRDGDSLLIVRYSDLHRAVQQAMADLTQAQTPTLPYQDAQGQQSQQPI
jgi:PAB-dependent poly(A)-specific ribonuclease subunit 3